jgi:hypothetical protein
MRGRVLATAEARSDSATEDRRPSPFALLFAPGRAMDLQARAGRARWILLFVWSCSLLLATALAIRADAGSSTLRELEMSGELRNMSDRQIADETRKAERIFQVMSVAKGAVTPLLDLGLGCLTLLGLCWFFRGRVKGRAVVPVAAATLLPSGIANLLDAASAFQHSAMPPEGVALAPRSLSALGQLVGHPLVGPWVKLGTVIDFPSLWSAILVAYGVASVGQIPKRNALIGTIIAWLCYRLLTQVAMGK